MYLLSSYVCQIILSKGRRNPFSAVSFIQMHRRNRSRCTAFSCIPAARVLQRARTVAIRMKRILRSHGDGCFVSIHLPINHILPLNSPTAPSNGKDGRLHFLRSQRDLFISLDYMLITLKRREFSSLRIN